MGVCRKRVALRCCKDDSLCPRRERLLLIQRVVARRRSERELRGTCGINRRQIRGDGLWGRDIVTSWADGTGAGWAGLQAGVQLARVIWSPTVIHCSASRRHFRSIPTGPHLRPRQDSRWKSRASASPHSASRHWRHWGWGANVWPQGGDSRGSARPCGCWTGLKSAHRWRSRGQACSNAASGASVAGGSNATDVVD